MAPSKTATRNNPTSKSHGHRHSEEEEEETLLTQKSLQLSLSPPRCPPFDTAHRSILSGNPSHNNNNHNISTLVVVDHHGLQHTAHSDYNHHTTIRERMELVLHNARSSIMMMNRIHPHLSVGPELSDQITRFLGTLLPLESQNHFRDNGGFRSLSDRLVTASIPIGAIANPTAARSFLQLTRRCKYIQYGPDESQFIEMHFPDNNKNENENENNNNENENGNDNNNENDDGTNIDDDDDDTNSTGIVFFVHGGAWGSGKPWFYRLCALPFLKNKKNRLNMAVAIVGYRTYPTGNVDAQVSDLQAAYQRLSKEYPDLIGPLRKSRPFGVCVMGHSSGAHIALLMIVEQIKKLLLAENQQQQKEEKEQQGASSEIKSDVIMPLVDSFVGISGPYDISHHFDYEAARGVEELSPMKAANGYTREQFRINTPHLKLKAFLAETLSPEFSTSANSPGGGDGDVAEASIDLFFPRSLLVHGIEDDTVPFTATSETAHVLRSCGITRCDEYYAPLTGHQDAVMHLMLGGRVERAIVDWLLKQQQPRTYNNTTMTRSRL